jgi:hypothetical protein
MMMYQMCFTLGSAEVLATVLVAAVAEEVRVATPKRKEAPITTAITTRELLLATFEIYR